MPMPAASSITDEKDSPWVPFGENAAIKHLLFDTRHNIYSNILWMKGPSVVGTHKHRGYVVMVCLEGSVRYLEYDWVATEGCFIYETPGEAHTLVTDHPEGCKLFGWMRRAERILRSRRQSRDDRGRLVVSWITMRATARPTIIAEIRTLPVEFSSC